MQALLAFFHSENLVDKKHKRKRRKKLPCNIYRWQYTHKNPKKVQVDSDNQFDDQSDPSGQNMYPRLKILHIIIFPRAN